VRWAGAGEKRWKRRVGTETRPYGAGKTRAQSGSNHRSPPQVKRRAWGSQLENKKVFVGIIWKKKGKGERNWCGEHHGVEAAQEVEMSCSPDIKGRKDEEKGYANHCVGESTSGVWRKRGGERERGGLHFPRSGDVVRVSKRKGRGERQGDMRWLKEWGEGRGGGGGGRSEARNKLARGKYTCQKRV